MKNNCKKILICLLSVLAIASFAAGCKNENPSDSSNTQEPEIVEIAISQAELTMGVGEIVTLSAQSISNETPIWFSSNEAVATVDGNGAVTAVSEGVAEVSVVIGGYVDSCEITVLKDSYAIVLNTDNVLLPLNKSFEIVPQFTYKGNPINDGVGYSWNVDDSNVATVENGKISAVAYGETKITLTATCAEKTLTKEIFVTVKSSVEMFVSETTLSLSVYDADGKNQMRSISCIARDNGDVIENLEITWQSLNSDIASVDEIGNITAQNVGDTVVVGSCEIDGYTYSCSTEIHVDYTRVSLGEKIDVETARTTTLTLPVLVKDTVKSVFVGQNSVAFEQNGETLNINATGIAVGANDTITIQGEKTIHSGSCFVSTMAIASAEDFKTMRALTHTVDGYFYLKNDIDFENTGVSGDATFKGTFDGCGYAIKNFQIEWVTTRDSGLFGKVVTGTSTKYTVLKNFSLINVTGGADASGALANQIKWYTTVESVLVEGTLTRGSSTIESAKPDYSAMSGMLACGATSYVYFRNCIVIDNAPDSILRSGGLAAFVGYGVSAQPFFYNCYAVSIAERALMLGYAESNYASVGCTLESGWKDGTLSTAFKSMDLLTAHLEENATAAEKLALLSVKDDGTYWGSTKII